ncbi:zinc finger protein AEBP2 [Naviculisporaceae sp. PSN 640]
MGDFSYLQQPLQDYNYTSLSYSDSACVPPRMQRTVSENTDRSGHSTGSNETYRSAGEYQLQPSSVSTFDYSVPGYITSYDNDNQETDYFASIGSQYQDVEAAELEYPSSTTSVQLLESREGDEAAAWEATSQAQGWLSQTSYQAPNFSWIRCDDVDRALGNLQKQNPAVTNWEAVQEVLQQHLFRYLSRHPRTKPQSQRKIMGALQEAACQIQMRVQGEEALDICYFAIAAVLAKLREESFGVQETGGPSSSGAQPTSSQRFVCRFPDCKQGAFGRAADLERHHKMVHLPDDKKTKFFCDYKRCARHDSPFFRQDHFRDHLRDFHKEDLLRRGNKAEDKWWKARSSYALYNGWWRCNRCLVTRVSVETDGWVCPKCNMHCETERQKRRTSAQH